LRDWDKKEQDVITLPRKTLIYWSIGTFVGAAMAIIGLVYASLSAC